MVISVVAFVIRAYFITIVAISKLMGDILEESEKIPDISKNITKKHATSGGR